MGAVCHQLLSSQAGQTWVFQHGVVGQLSGVSSLARWGSGAFHRCDLGCVFLHVHVEILNNPDGLPSGNWLGWGLIKNRWACESRDPMAVLFLLI